VPIDLGPESSTVTLQLAATGVRSQGDVGAYAVAIGDQLATVTAVEISPTALGVDLITISLQRSLIGLGEVELTVSVDGKTSNAVKVSFL
jgi:hypothetical protein